MSVGAWLVVACALAGASGCRRTPDGPPVVPADMSWVSTTDDPEQWRDGGFVELVTPVRPPTTDDGAAHIVVVLKLPDGAPLRLDAAHPLSFDLPVGTVASRVEYSGTAHAPDAQVDPSWRVLDVREFEWTADGVDCSVRRPDGDGKLVGLRWRCGEDADARAGERLATYAREGRFAGPRGDRGRARSAQRVQLLNACSACHQASRAEDRRVTALVQRGTDASGLFSLAAVFRDEDPVERYRPVDTNAGDPVMTPICPGSAIDVVAARCQDGLRPRLRVDVARGVRDGAPHVRRLCESRRQLADRLDARGRTAIASALAVCAAR